MERRWAWPIAALAVLLAMAGCGGGGRQDRPVTPPRAAGSVDIIGSAYLVQPKGSDHGPLPTFVELWAQIAGIAPGDSRLLYTFTGDAGGITLFCRLREPLTVEELEAELAALPADDPARATAEYALRHRAYLFDASMLLLSRRPTREEADGCREQRVSYAELLLGTVRCGARTCPVLLLVKPNRLTAAIARSLVEAIAAEPGLLDDFTGLALTGIMPLPDADAQRTREAASTLLGGRGRPTR